MRAQRMAVLTCLALFPMLAAAPGASATPGALAAPGASAAPAGQAQVPPGLEAFGPLPDPPSIPWLRVLGGTAAVVGLICLGVFAVKKLNGGLPFNRGRHMEVLEVRPAGRKVHLLLVRVADRIVLLACCGTNVTRLAELPAEDLPELKASEAQAQALGFRALFRKLAGGQA